MRLLYLVCWLVLLSVDQAHSEDYEDDEDPIMVQPDYTKAPAGGDIAFKCFSPLPNSTMVWIHPNGTDINEMNDSRLSYNEMGGLYMVDLELWDSGDYMCIASNTLISFNTTGELEVYIMPDYFKEGMIVVAINIVLIIVFCICMIHSTIRNRKRYGGRQPVAATPIEEVMVDTTENV